MRSCYQTLRRLQLVCSLALFCAAPALAGEQLVSTAKYPSGEVIPYILDSEGDAPRYVVLLFPGGSGVMDPRLQDGRLVYGFRGNFLIRARRYLVDREFASVATNTTTSEERVQALLDDIGRRFPQAKVYVMGTSNGTYATMRLAEYLSGRVAGVIHTSSLNAISQFDSRQYKNRQLIVSHVDDVCRATRFSASKDAAERYGTDFIAMQGGISVGEYCEAFSHHGYNGIERETMEKIKDWIRKGG
ncbi:MAG TPA: alpha/beta hydrolase [Burkholderiales bacterium]|jgi:predicted esterase|nr:alpha/beta hydrolase [Burkholderiales bacterium]